MSEDKKKQAPPPDLGVTVSDELATTDKTGG